MTRARRNKARALESLVDSPGRAAWNPRSETFSSSISDGYSVWMSSSLSNLGRPRVAADKLVAVRIDTKESLYAMSLPVYSIQCPENLLSGFTCERSQGEAFLALM